jgi:hypothetical protein
MTMTISESLLEKDKAKVERESYPVEIIGTTAGRHANRKHDASIRSTARYDNNAENWDHKYYTWSTPTAFAFFGVLILLAILFANFLALFIDLGQW